MRECKRSWRGGVGGVVGGRLCALWWYMYSRASFVLFFSCFTLLCLSQELFSVLMLSLSLPLCYSAFGDSFNVFISFSLLPYLLIHTSFVSLSQQSFYSLSYSLFFCLLKEIKPTILFLHTNVYTNVYTMCTQMLFRLSPPDLFFWAWCFAKYSNYSKPSIYKSNLLGLSKQLRLTKIITSWMV